MGCDIHIVLERKLPGREWIGLWSSDAMPGRQPLVARRDYDFFTQAANVRGRSETAIYPRNLPEDVSRLAWVEYISAATDHHSVSHMTPAEFAAAYVRANPEAREGYRPEYAINDLLGFYVGEPEGADYRVVFWFDN